VKRSGKGMFDKTGEMRAKPAVLFRRGRVIDPESGFDQVADVLVDEGIIRKLGKELKAAGEVEVVEAENKIIAPGLIDLHVHISEPARNDRETIRSGCSAAVAGGITTIVVRSHTDLIIDNQAVVEYLIAKSRALSLCRLLPVGALTQGLRGEALAEMADLARNGIVAASDDCYSVMNASLMRRALEYAAMHRLPVFSFCQDKSLAGDGAVNEGYISTLMGLSGIPDVAEEVMVVRDLILARMTGCPIHLGPITTAGSLGLIEQAQKTGVRVTAETSPHYFILSDSDCREYDTFTKVSPPLRSEKDVSALRQGIADGTIGVISSGHQPLTVVDKDTEFPSAVNGISALETLLPLSLTYLFHNNKLSLKDLLARMTINPAKILNLPSGRIQEKAPADLIVFDADEQFAINPKKFLSRGKNTPFLGRSVRGRVLLTMVGGRIVFRNGELVPV
jgi:dihydroorotase